MPPKKKAEPPPPEEELLAPPVTELEREEMRLQVEHLQEKLKKGNDRVVEVWELMEELRLSKEKEREDQKEVVVYLKSEIDKQKDAALELERRYAELVSEQGAEETRMAEELEASRRLNKAQAEEENAILSEQARKLELHAEYMRAQEHAKSLAAGTEEGQARLEALQAEVERLNSLLPILTHHEATAQGGARAVPLLVLEALRDFPIKRELQREGWMAVASLLAVKPADENARQLKEAGALSLALTTLQVHEDHLDVQSAAIGFVWKLMFCDASSREQAADSGATHLILRAIARHPNERGNLAPARIIAAHRMLLYNAAGALRVIIGAEMADLQADAPAGILNSPTPIAAAAADGAAAGEGAHSPPPSGRPKQHAAAAATPSPALPPIGSGNATAAGGEGGEGGEAPSGGRGARGAAAQARSAPLLRSLQARAGGGRAGGPRGRKRTTADDSRGAARGRKASTVEQSAEQKKRSIAIAAQALVLTCKAMRDMPRHSLVQEHGCGAIRSLMLSHPKLSDTFVTQRAADVIAMAMEEHPMQGAVQHNAIKALLAVAPDQHVFETFKLNDRVENLIKRAEINHVHNSDVLRGSMSLLAFFPKVKVAAPSLVTRMNSGEKDALLSSAAASATAGTASAAGTAGA